MVFQKPNPFPKSIYDNVAYGPKLTGAKRSELDDIVQRALEQAALWDEVKDRLKKSALGLSGGQQQRLCLARTVAVDPEIILMDEPFAALDAQMRTLLQEELLTLWQQSQRTVLFITHSIEEAVGLSDRVVVMSPSPGRIVREMTIDLPRPRPLALGEAPALEEHVQAIYGLFEEMGVLHGKDGGPRGARGSR
jgi:phosphate transport system ATP-binding protein